MTTSVPVLRGCAGWCLLERYSGCWWRAVLDTSLDIVHNVGWLWLLLVLKYPTKKASIIRQPANYYYSQPRSTATAAFVNKMWYRWSGEKPSKPPTIITCGASEQNAEVEAYWALDGWGCWDSWALKEDEDGTKRRLLFWSTSGGGIKIACECQSNRSVRHSGTTTDMSSWWPGI